MANFSSMDDFKAKEYWEHRLGEHYDLGGVGDIGLSKAYNEALYDVRSYGFKLLLSRLGLPLGNASVLDIGSGTGFYVDLWLTVGAGKVTGSDLTTTATSRLANNFPETTVLQLDIGETDIDIEPGKFNFISAFDVLFHIVDDQRYEQAFKNFATLLKAGGLLIFSDNLMDGNEIRIAHQVARSRSSVFSILEKAGFELILTQPMFVLMNDPVRSSSRILKRCFAAVYRIASRGDIAGTLLGFCLSPIEKLLIRILSTGPSTETFVWRKIDQS